MPPPPLQLPAREQFLATGLENADRMCSSCRSPIKMCSICRGEPLVSPVSTICKHVFCRVCIVEWLNTPGVNNCPLCRRNFFVRPVEVREDEAPAPLQRSRRQVERAFHAIGLGQLLLQAYPPRADRLTFFHNDILWNQREMHQSALFALDWVAADRGLLEDGGQTIVNKTLGSSLIVMGNLLMEIARMEQRAYSDADKDTWREIVVDIWRFMSRYRGRCMYLNTLYRALVAFLFDKYCFSAVHPSPFFEDGPLLDDFQILVNFVIFKSGRFIRWRNPMDRSRRSRNREVPRDCPCTLSEPAVLHATQWMEDVFERDPPVEDN